ncbi:SRPBCC domain-containing protein [Sporichthya sp.]|uniref:SRPBCC domain-containing protein n=1 Tax=Sporichthya sp. TaxID=65475 RepID=UPI0017E48DC5|nr:SRPBCC domain-containing protein [Sporichthya sp.]MBA3742186.1 SRPBCC domain-containing protein [Sporichthya sp.]
MGFSFGWEPAEGLPEIAVGSSRVEVTLVADGGDTVLTLRHSGIPARYGDDHAEGWAHELCRLAEAVQTAT